MNAILQRLLDMDAKNRLHHGFLWISNGDFSQKEMEQTALLFVQHLLSKGSSPSEKEIIQKKISNRNHPDFFLLQSPEAEIKMEEIREMQRWLAPPPLEASKKIVLIHDAHQLSLACSNALLKTLEEPPHHALLILLSRSVSRILPTIRSRLFCIQFAEDQKAQSEEEKEWMDELRGLLAKKTYTDKDIFSFTEKLSDQRTDLVFFFDILHRTIRDRMLEATPASFNKLEKVHHLATNLEQELYQNYGNIPLGLDRFFMEWRNT